MRKNGFGHRQLAILAIATALPLMASWMMPAARQGALAGGVAITGLIMLAFAGLGFMGFPVKGDADPRDLAAAAAGLILSGLVFFLM